jgi:hypothetical protein
MTAEPSASSLLKPAYTGTETDGAHIGFAVEDMKRHMTDEGWQLFAGLESAGYILAGHNLPYAETDVRKVLEHHDPSIVVLQDRREWTNRTADRRQDPKYQFRNWEALKERDDVFKVTVLKDAHADSHFHRHTAFAMGCHAWIVYYHPEIVAELAPYVRPHNLIRTYHTIDKDIVPEVTTDGRHGAVLSGAISRAYPLRVRIRNYAVAIPGLYVMRHPGYHRRGSNTPEYLKELCEYKVAICTSSRYQYALRKIIEATACGCIVVTDLPGFDTLPEIDGNLVRVSPDISMEELRDLVQHLCGCWDLDTQRMFAEKAKAHYDYRAMGKELACQIQLHRKWYNMT